MCPSCGSTNVEVLAEAGGTTLYHCKDCDEPFNG